MNRDETKFLEDYVESSSKTVNNRRTLRQMEKNHPKTEEKRKRFGSEELNERLIEELVKKSEEF